MIIFLRRFSALLFGLALALPTTAHAQGLALKPFKDELFAYPAVLASEGEAYRVVDYREARDIEPRKLDDLRDLAAIVMDQLQARLVSRI